MTGLARYEKLPIHRNQLSKEITIIVSAFLVIFASGGLILEFSLVYSKLVREQQWVEWYTAEEQKNKGSVFCDEQEIQLQFVFSTEFLCLSAANAFFEHWVILIRRLACGVLRVSMGGMGAYLAAFQILYLYEVQGMVYSTLSSLFMLGVCVHAARGLWITRSAFFRIYGVVMSACALICYLLFPTKNIARPHDFSRYPTCRIEMPRINAPAGLVDSLQEEKSSDG
ncbi:unnamed protein product [Peronospora destructor]|uniref:Uncharacterized protein n=1 Tax=Peronospora destructor TaxID=86335 RepID=A0AAV0TVU2_9STRA|nr:unnamed protein product [Peronospora destructor]